MLSQILATVLDLLMNGRMIVFLLGVMLGGMLTVSNSFAYESSETLLEWWTMVINTVVTR